MSTLAQRIDSIIQKNGGSRRWFAKKTDRTANSLKYQIEAEVSPEFKTMMGIAQAADVLPMIIHENGEVYAQDELFDQETYLGAAVQFARRDKLGFTQRRVADMACMNVSQVSRLESHKHNITTRTTTRLLDKLGLDVEYLVEYHRLPAFGVHPVTSRFIQLFRQQGLQKLSDEFAVPKSLLLDNLQGHQLPQLEVIHHISEGSPYAPIQLVTLQGRPIGPDPHEPDYLPRALIERCKEMQIIPYQVVNHSGQEGFLEWISGKVPTHEGLESIKGVLSFKARYLV